jgi:hypothetical protein
MKHRVITEYKIMLQKMIKRSLTITTETNLSEIQSNQLTFHGSIDIMDIDSISDQNSSMLFFIVYFDIC